MTLNIWLLSNWQVLTLKTSLFTKDDLFQNVDCKQCGCFYVKGNNVMPTFSGRGLPFSKVLAYTNNY